MKNVLDEFALCELTRIMWFGSDLRGFWVFVFVTAEAVEGGMKMWSVWQKEKEEKRVWAIRWPAPLNIKGAALHLAAGPLKH